MSDDRQATRLRQGGWGLGRVAPGPARQDRPARGRRRHRRAGWRSRSIAAEMWVLLGLVVVDHGRSLHRLPAAVAHPGQVPGPRHDLPDRLPDRPGDLHGRDRVHELRRRPPRHQGRRDHRDRDGLGPAGAGLAGVRPDDRHRRATPRPGPRLPAGRPGHQGGPGRATPTGSQPLPDAHGQRDAARSRPHRA